MRVPRFVKAIIFTIVVGIGAVSYAGWKTADVRHEQDRKACDRAVANRDDGRAVWLYLVARNPERRDDPDVIDFITFLNDRLPPLVCVDGIPTPTTPEED